MTYQQPCAPAIVVGRRAQYNPRMRLWSLVLTISLAGSAAAGATLSTYRNRVGHYVIVLRTEDGRPRRVFFGIPIALHERREAVVVAVPSPDVPAYEVRLSLERALHVPAPGSSAPARITWDNFADNPHQPASLGELSERDVKRLGDAEVTAAWEADRCRLTLVRASNF